MPSVGRFINLNYLIIPTATRASPLVLSGPRQSVHCRGICECSTSVSTLASQAKEDSSTLFTRSRGPIAQSVRAGDS